MSYYLQLARRQLRLPVVKLFCLSLALATAVTLSITLISDRVEKLFTEQSRDLLAADLVLSGSNPVSPEQTQLMANYPGQTAETLSFRSMVSTSGSADNGESSNASQFVLADVKAVSAAYPLRGNLQVSDQAYGTPQTATHGPITGTAWVDDRVYNELGLSVGDSLSVGEIQLKVTQVLLLEPDRGDSFYSLTPRVMIALDDVARANVLQPGSRARYRYLFANTDSPNDLINLQNDLQQTLSSQQEFISVERANEALSDSLTKAYQFLRITALLAILLGAVAVALVTYQYCRSLTPQYALLRCLGVTNRRLLLSVALPFALFFVVGTAVGLSVGYGFHTLLVWGVQEYLPDALPAASITPWLVSLLAALIIVLGFAVPLLQGLLKISPKALFSATDALYFPRFWGTVSISISLLLLIQFSTRDWLLTLGIGGGLLLFTGLCVGFVLVIMRMLRGYSEGPRVKATHRLGSRLLLSERALVTLQTIAIAITVFALALIQTLRDDLIVAWQAQVPENAPNFFIINLYPEDEPEFVSLMDRLELNYSPLYPISRGRLLEINGDRADDYAESEGSNSMRSEDGALDRDLALTASAELADDNTLIEGTWHQGQPAIVAGSQFEDEVTNEAIPSVSVEADLAESLGISIGDRLLFEAGGIQFPAIVSSLRTVQWENLTPNFYFIFSEDALDTLPVTMIGSVNIPDRSVLSDIVSTFPHAVAFDIEFVINRVQSITTQVSFVVELILYCALLASLIIFITIELILRRSRRYASAILKSSGAQYKTVAGIFNIQFIIVGLLAGLFAYFMTVAVGYFITVVVMQSVWVFNIKTFLLCLLVTPLLVVASSRYSIKRINEISPKILLNA